MRFDPIAVVQEATTSWVASNGNDYPMVSFKPLQKPESAMEKYTKPLDKARISVPNFPALLAASTVAKYSMMFRFRPTYDAADAGDDVFACRSLLFDIHSVFTAFYPLPEMLYTFFIL